MIDNLDQPLNDVPMIKIQAVEHRSIVERGETFIGYYFTVRLTGIEKAKVSIGETECLLVRDIPRTIGKIWRTHAPTTETQEGTGTTAGQ